MRNVRNKDEGICKSEAKSFYNFRETITELAEKVITNCKDSDIFTHVDNEPIPDKECVIEIIEQIRHVLFPGYFSNGKVDPINLSYVIGQSVSMIFDMLSEQIRRSIRHDCFRYNLPCSDCLERSCQIAKDFIESIPSIRKTLATDVKAAYEGDPAAKSHDEIIISYPGLYAISIYRIAHKLYEFKTPLIPRIMTEYAHSLTGIDIHPGAQIGEYFFIDHGTGVVIGETTVIGKNVRIYQGVTLGALSLPKDAGDLLRDKKRHPTIENDVIIYSGATILGGNTIIGARSIIGGNVWITESVPADTKVLIEAPKLVYM